LRNIFSFHEKLGVLDLPQAELAMQKLATAIERGSVEDVLLAF